MRGIIKTFGMAWISLGLILATVFLDLPFSSAQESVEGLRLKVADLILDGKFADAEPQAKQWLAIAERKGLESADVADALEALIKIYAGLKRFDDVEVAWRRCLELRVKLVGKKHALITHTIDIMAGIYIDQGRRSEAQKLWREGLAAFDKGPSIVAVERIPNPANPTHRHVPDLIAKGNFKEAENVLRQNGDQETLATFLLDRNRLSEARAIHRRLLDLAPTAERATKTATLYRQRGLFAQEQEFLEKAVGIQEKTLGQEHAELIPTLTALAGSFERSNNLRKAYVTQKRAAGIAGANRLKQAFTTPVAVALGQRQPYVDFLRIAMRLARANPSESTTIAQESFEAGQLVTETVLNATVSQMALRLSSGGGALPELIRSRQDLEREWRRLDRLLLAAVTSANSEVERNGLRGQLASVEGRLAGVDEQLRKTFPQYFDLAVPIPLNVTDTQSLLQNREALVQFAVSGEQAYVWVVTKSDVRWAAVAMPPSDIERSVAALRCGLDFEGSWGTNASAKVKQRCHELVNRTYNEADSRVPRPMPFDLRRAYQLYVALFGSVEELIKDKELLVIPSGPLSSLPLQVLVMTNVDTAFPADWDGYARANWLVKAHALNVVPSVASLKAIRLLAGRSLAVNPYIAFANPAVGGKSGNDSIAAQRQTCTPGKAWANNSARAPAVRAVPAHFFRGELGITEKIRRMQPLLETADEVCAVAGELGASDHDVFLGPRATEHVVKSLSRSGALETYRVIHLATHGLLASETELMAGGPTEPALVLTPPNEASQEDDGLLTSGEILQLKLNADWVILSACNTAGGERAGADALSGLARAVFYAGARALLVSHWAVDSTATVAIITGTFKSWHQDRAAGRGEALRRAVLRMMSARDPGAHPAYWAPFVVVGAGSRTQ